MKGCLLVFCGLPASGKSTLVSELCSFFSREFNILVADYDKLMPPEKEKQLIESNGSLWKECRESIVTCVDQLLNYIMLEDDDSNAQGELANVLHAKRTGNINLLKHFQLSEFNVQKIKGSCVNDDLSAYDCLELVAAVSKDLIKMESSNSHKESVTLCVEQSELVGSSNYTDELEQELPGGEPERDSNVFVSGDSEVKASEQSKLMKSKEHCVYRTENLRDHFSQGSSNCHWTDNFELRPKVVKHSTEESQLSGVRRGIVVIVDDNMYYRSMRYDYYQLARKYSLGFSEVLLECPIEMVLKRNEQRKYGKVTDKVITEMAAKMEFPDSAVHQWEKHSVHLLPDSLHKCEQVLKIVNSAMDDPVITQVEDVEGKAESRRICSANMVHQGDQILRKLLAVKMKSAKERGLSKLDMKMYSAKLAEVKATILDDMRSGVITFDSEVTEASKDENCELFKCVSSIFEKNISHIS